MKKGANNKNEPKQEKQTGAQSAENLRPVSATLSNTFFSDGNLKKIFFFSILGILAIVWLTGYNVGFHGDEMDMNNYGKANFAFYSSGGKDRSCERGTINTVDTTGCYLLRYYGCAFEYIAVGTNKILGTDKGAHEFDVRHVYSEIFGIICLLLAGLIAQKLADWRAALFTIWLIFLSPSFFGHVYINTKDIPFCAGYLASLYFIIKLLEELPDPTWRTSTWLMLSLAFTLNTRIGGLILLMYLFLFMGIYAVVNKELLKQCFANAKNIIIKLAYICVASVVLMVLTWPFILLNPMTRIPEALGVVSKFPLKVNINFEGASINSLTIPNHYLPKFMLLTTPIIVMVLLAIAMVLVFLKRRNYNMKLVMLLLVTILFPPLYAVAQNVALYSGWRHFLFIYPGICIIAALGLNELMKELNKPVLQLVVGVACLAGFIKPLIFTFQNHPYEYCYFNEFAGGFKTAYYNYDTDYWMISMKKSMDWLIKNEPIAQSKDSITIASNQNRFIQYYLSRHCPGAKVRVIPSGVTGRNALAWTYGVYSNFFVKPDYLENYFPPAQTVYSESIDGLTICAVVKDTARLDYKALEALKIAHHNVSDSLYMAYIKTTKDDNPALFAYISVAKASTNQNDAAIAAANKALQYHFSNVLDYNAQCGLGIAYANKRQFDLSINALRIAEKLMPQEHYSKDILQQVFKVMQEEKAMGAAAGQPKPPGAH